MFDADLCVIVAKPLIAFCMKADEVHPAIADACGKLIRVKIGPHIRARCHRMVIEKQRVFGAMHMAYLLVPQ
jgi:hypothetical protein